MARAKYQVLIIPFKSSNNKILYGIFKRNDMQIWQFIAGGGEDEDSSPLSAAKREAFEEGNILKTEKYFSLETQCSIPTSCFKTARSIWGKEFLVIPEYSFAVEISNSKIHLSNEHLQYEWVDYDTALQRLRYDSNKTALWELDNKIKMGLIY